MMVDTSYPYDDMMIVLEDNYKVDQCLHNYIVAYDLYIYYHNSY